MRLSHVAMVHLMLRTPADPPRRIAPEAERESENVDGLPLEEFRFRMVRRISSWLGQPAHCRRAACRRGKLCRGDPPDCWRDEPPPSEDEITQAKATFHAALTAANDANKVDD